MADRQQRANHIYADQARERGIKPIGSVMPDYLARKPKLPKGINTELQEFVNETRKEFGETAKKGAGSFSYYMGFCKRLSMFELYRIRANIRDSRNVQTPGRLFIWAVNKRVKELKGGTMKKDAPAKGE